MSDYIVVFAGSAIDEFYEVPTWVDMGSAVLAQKKDTLVGGCMLNVALVANSLGLDTRTFDWLNSTEGDSQTILNFCKDHGLPIDNINLTPDVQNGKCLIMCCGGDKVIFVLPCKHPTYDLSDGSLQNLLNGAKVIYSLTKDFRMALGEDLTPLKIAKEHGAKVVMDGESHYTDPKDVRDIFLADALILNDQALARLKQAVGEDAVCKLHQSGTEYVCETLGDKGVNVYQKGRDMLHVDSLPVTVLDSTGAGDTFIGSFIYGWVQGWEAEKIASFATAAGARACTIMGGTGGCGTTQEIFEFAKAYGREI